MKQRDRTLDIAKGIRMVLVVSYHIILCSPTTENWFECFCGVLGFFTFAAGYTYRPGRRTFGESMMSRVTGMMIPYFKISFIALTCWPCKAILTENEPGVFDIYAICRKDSSIRSYAVKISFGLAFFSRNAASSQSVVSVRFSLDRIRSVSDIFIPLPSIANRDLPKE